jgi:8-hydroxy-5-deazaflavin:NADPH oxidoreductase
MSHLKIFIAGGTGPVGGTVATVLAKTGHTVVIGSRHPTAAKSQEALRKAKSITGQAYAHLLSCETAIPADVDCVIIALPCQADKAALLQQAHFLKRIGIAGKVVIDMTNPFKGGDGMLSPELCGTTSAAEEFQKALSEARVFKALNTIGCVNLGTNFRISGHKPATMMYAGDEPGNKAVETIIAATGFVPTWCGPLRYARSLESIAQVYVGMAYVSRASPTGDNRFAITFVAGE